MSNFVWFGDGADDRTLADYGFRLKGGGVHQTKTIMLRELGILNKNRASLIDSLEAIVIDQNALAKATVSARRLALARLRALYGLGHTYLITQVLDRLWARNAHACPQLALLAALARDPLLRDSSAVVLAAELGISIRWPAIAAQLEISHPGRFSPKMLKSLSQNCTSSWTQSGHLIGKVNKRRSRSPATAVAAAYAALLASLAGFGGPALLQSPWLAVTDSPLAERLDLLRQAESLGLARVRAAGDILEISVRGPMLETLGISAHG